MADQPDTYKSVDEVNGETTATGAVSRRRLLRGLGSAAPVILTLASNPVAASQCVVASSFASTLALSSRKPTSAQPCSGTTPSGWRGVTSPFTSCGVAGTVTFKDIFGTANKAWATGTSFTSSTTLMQALNASSGANAQLAQYCTAAYLNMKANKVSATVLNQTQIVAIWSGVTNGGIYTPSTSSSVKFTSAQCVTWLAAMMA